MESADVKSDQELAQDASIREAHEAVNEGRMTTEEYLLKVIAVLWTGEKVNTVLEPFATTSGGGAAAAADDDDNDDDGDDDDNDNDDDDDDDDDAPIVEDITDATDFTQLAQATKQASRFECGERVICRLPAGWAPGKVVEQNQSDLQGVPNCASASLVHIQLDIGPWRMRLGHHTVYVEDTANGVRREVCFRQHPDTESFTRACLPPRQSACGQKEKLRFAVGERVACLIEADFGDCACWKGGFVAELWPRLTSSEDGGDVTAAYTVQLLDSDCRVSVHRDDHLLVRDLKYQAEGAHRACSKRFTKRRCSDANESGEWEMVDHSTRQTRACSPPLEEEVEEGGTLDGEVEVAPPFAYSQGPRFGMNSPLLGATAAMACFSVLPAPFLEASGWGAV
jgi:hypothetical protein